MLLNQFASHRTTVVLSNLDSSKWIELIRHSDYIAKIQEGRPYKFVNEKLYDEYKACVPCITPNFLYRNTHDDINIIRPTGLLYIDIDPKKGQPFDFDPKILDKSKIYSYFKTFSGIGYGILVKVEGLTKENFKDTFHAICQDLGISQYFDKNARKASQYLALSYDPDVYFNPDSFLFSSVTKTAPPSIVKEKKRKTYTNDGGAPASFDRSLRFDNLDEIEIEDDYIVNWQGFKYIKVWLPMKKIKTDFRYSFFLSYTTNIMWLNQHSHPNAILKMLRNVNELICEEPIADDQLKKVVKCSRIAGYVRFK